MGQLEEHPLPPDDFKERDLPVFKHQILWYRLNNSKYRSALYFDRSDEGRFDGPEQGYGILYVAESIAGTFIECFGRTLGEKGVSEDTVRQKNLFQIEFKRLLCLVDLFGNGLAKIGADARLSSGSYDMARRWAKAIWEHPQKVDGIRYRSRHDNDLICCGFFHRIQDLLVEKNQGNLVDNHPEVLGKILDRYDYYVL